MADKVLPVDREALGKWLFDNRDNLRYTQDWADLTPSTQEMWRQKADALIASPVLRALAENVWGEAYRQGVEDQISSDAVGGIYSPARVNPFAESSDPFPYRERAEQFACTARGHAGCERIGAAVVHHPYREQAR